MDFLASTVNYSDHLLPIFKALPDDLKGMFYGSSLSLNHLRSRGIPAVRFVNRPDGPIVVAGWSDYNLAKRRDVILLEHGAGQGYLLDGVPDRNPSNPGGVLRERVTLFLCTNESVAERNRRWWPEAVSEVVGCCKLDKWVKSQGGVGESGHPTRFIPSEIVGSNPAPATAAVGELAGSGSADSHSEPERPPIIALAFHWPNPQVPESRWAFEHYRPGFKQLAEQFPGILGHAHPRAFTHLEPHYEAAGIEPVRTFDEVLERADLLCVDNSSVGFEFAAVKGPIVWLNCPTYRRDVEHGLRFWELSYGGLHAEGPEELPAVIRHALRDPMEAERAEVTRQVYPFLGEATQRAVAAIIRHATA